MNRELIKKELEILQCQLEAFGDTIQADCGALCLANNTDTKCVDLYEMMRFYVNTYLEDFNHISFYPSALDCILEWPDYKKVFGVKAKIKITEDCYLYFPDDDQIEYEVLKIIHNNIAKDIVKEYNSVAYNIIEMCDFKGCKRLILRHSLNTIHKIQDFYNVIDAISDNWRVEVSPNGCGIDFKYSFGYSTIEDALLNRLPKEVEICTHTFDSNNNLIPYIIKRSVIVDRESNTITLT